MSNPHIEIAQRLDQYKQHFRRETKRAEEMEASAQAIKDLIHAEMMRADRGLPAPDACPDCWIEEGAVRLVISKRADDPVNFDRWGCPVCEFYFDVPSH